MPDFNRHLGLLLKSPDLGRKRLVFSYCELLDDNYAIYTDDGTKVTPTVIPNFYGPDLADNDSTLLVETIVNGQAEIWLGRFPGDSPRFQTRGESPSWQPGGNFIFIRDGRLMTQNIHELEENTLQVSGNSRDAASAAKKNIIAFCTDQKSGNALNIQGMVCASILAA